MCVQSHPQFQIAAITRNPQSTIRNPRALFTLLFVARGGGGGGGEKRGEERPLKADDYDDCSYRVSHINLQFVHAVQFEFNLRIILEYVTSR